LKQIEELIRVIEDQTTELKERDAKVT